MFEATQSLGALVAGHPAAARVLERHGIDYCCGGEKSIGDACRQKGISPAALLEEIGREERARPATRVDDLSTAALIDHIVSVYHRPLDTELPRLHGLARKVQGAHGPKDPSRFEALTALVEDLAETLAEHMELEEETVFPKLRAASGDAPELAHTLVDDHEQVGAMLRELRRLTRDYVVPPEACRSWTALWQGLEALELALHEHIHLENNILLPRASAAPHEPS